MLVYGDLIRRVRPLDLLAEVEADLRGGEPVSALIGLGQLAQAVADAEFHARGFDARSSAMDALMASLTDMWAVGRLDLPRLAALAPAEEVEVRIPEGYAFYALHPALYAAAAAQLPPGDWRVIGVRSIGTGLAAVAAAALGAPPPVTVRPVGHPFRRELRLAPDLEAEWAAHPGSFAIVDEGPGLSGSSFGAVADTLEHLGVPRERIAFLPGHDGDLGPQASPEHRARWSAARRPVARFEDVVLPKLARGVAALVAPATEPLRDISGGWRDLRAWPEPPPLNANQERRKFLHRTAEGAWLVKFAGLGRIGDGKLARARALHAAGFTPEPAGLVDGFLVERWADDAQPLHTEELLTDRLGDYLAFRAASFAAPAGAGLATLLEMVQVNTREALGSQAAEAVADLMGEPGRLQPRTRAVHVDGRLHRWEWTALPDGRVLKTDALDHSEAHDLIGPQDIIWDVAGAEAEFDLDAVQVEALRARAGADSEVLAFMRPAYLAFQLGLWTMAAEAQASWPEEAARARAQADRYLRRLARLLEIDPPAPPG